MKAEYIMEHDADGYLYLTNRKTGHLAENGVFPPQNTRVRFKLLDGRKGSGVTAQLQVRDNATGFESQRTVFVCCYFDALTATPESLHSVYLVEQVAGWKHVDMEEARRCNMLM